MSGVITESLGELLKKCPKITRIFLTALRTLTDHDLVLISVYASNLTQLDIMGTRNITAEGVYKYVYFFII